MLKSRPRLRRALLGALRLLVTAAAVGWVLSRVPLGDATDAMRAAPWWAFAAPAALLLTNSSLHAVRLTLLLRAGGVRVTVGVALGAILRGLFAGLALPRGGGDVVRAGWLARATGRLDAVVAAIALARVLELVPWLSLLLYGLWWGVLDAYPVVGGSAVVFSCAFAAALVLAASLVRAGPGLAQRLPLVRAPAVRLAEAVRVVSTAPRLVAAALALTLPIALFNVGSVWIVFKAYGASMPLGDVAAIVPAADTVIALPITLSGFGLREGVFVMLLTPFGVTESAAVAAGITRWTGELCRALMGGVLFLVGDTDPGAIAAEGVDSGPGPGAGGGG